VTLRRLLLVMLGGMVGTAGRLAIGLAVPDAAGIPLATLLVNVLGALLIGVLAARPFDRLRERGVRLREREARLREREARLREREARLREREARLRERDMRAFLGAGILGGFTTYSAFAVGSIELWADAPLAAVAYAALTLGLGIGAAVLGFRWGRPRGRSAL
jgi:CrcB protein